MRPSSALAGDDTYNACSVVRVAALRLQARRPVSAAIALLRRGAPEVLAAGTSSIRLLEFYIIAFK
jgi:hypothetical protein